MIRLYRDADARLVSLTGPGGTGKTRLALDIASELIDAFPDGVFFVDLATVRDPALVLASVASVLNVREVSPGTLPETLAAYLLPKRMLLVLDNCEQVITAASDVAALLAACPRLAILVTSREPLRIGAEQEFPVCLWASRRRHTPGTGGPGSSPGGGAVREPSDRDRSYLRPDRGECRRRCRNLPPPGRAAPGDRVGCGQDPAASTAGAVGPTGAAITTLTGGARDLPARQQTMRNTLAWSYDLLDDAEQAQFQFLSVFQGGFPRRGRVGGGRESRDRTTRVRHSGSPHVARRQESHCCRG